MARSVKVGIFIAGGIALFCVGLFLIGSRAQLFGSHFTAYAEFSNVDTLVAGSTVRVGGMNAGRVAAIQIPGNPSQKFRLKLQVDTSFRSIVRRDSVATIETEGMVGNKFVNIAEGTANSPLCAPGCILPSRESTSMGALMREGGKLAGSLQATITDIHHRADTIMKNIAEASGNVNGMIASVKPNVVGMTRNASVIVAGIRHGHGAAGKLLTDKQVATNVAQTIANARQATANLKTTTAKANTMIAQVRKSDLPPLHRTLANAQQMTHRINKAVGAFTSSRQNGEGTAQALSHTLQSAQQATQNLASDTNAIKHNFFLRGFFHRRGYFDLQTLTKREYARSRFVKKPTDRIWIPSTGLFSTGPHGRQQLTATGKAAVDQAMGRLVRWLPNNPIVVEGYDVAASPAQEYLDSRERAVDVRQYLQSHFHLPPNQLGIMPLGSVPPPHTGRKSWNGICLVLVAWRK